MATLAPAKVSEQYIAPWQLIRGSLNFALPSSPDEAGSISGSSRRSFVMEVPIFLYLPTTTNKNRLGGHITTPLPPVVVFSPGLLVDPTAYASYYHSLAGQGYPVVTYAKPGESLTHPVDDVSSQQLLRAVMDWCQLQSEEMDWFQLQSEEMRDPWPRCTKGEARVTVPMTVGMNSQSGPPPYPNSSGQPSHQTADPVSMTSSPSTESHISSRSIEVTEAKQPVNEFNSPQTAFCEKLSFVLSGHSRGGKISVLAAAEDHASGFDRVSGLMLLDPVDSSYESTAGPRFPSALPLLTGLTQLQEGDSDFNGALLYPAMNTMPVLIVGFGRNGDCVPPRSNYKSFLEAAASSKSLKPMITFALIKQAGHFSLLDELSFLQQSACSLGKVDKLVVQGLCQELTIQWLKALQELKLNLNPDFQARVTPLCLGYPSTCTTGYVTKIFLVPTYMH
ncbi:hypothetical protein CEUSTIGMA_g1218.t1 [Chlamydomonas eustigma]|uniref:Chlorophyllase n=1 Tax=Chlamydomonas eustigma TaxID=1157962 RepID=A0A250WSE4_9CHLO|nr:hypothetical protein CEUSTIGMA_g1218.t1 [Chlamydomonas eustigma]|eukprot:GAX73767.1 hypothetical protein CEUSTIGMA_g1218.t1 [Chlamydomonas eustigma]